jgi:hypothetical protein
MTQAIATRPSPGDAVRIRKPTSGWWSVGVKDGAIGIINGVVGTYPDHLEITFNYSAFRGPNNARSGGPEYVSVSGGPGSMFTPIAELSATDETAEIWFWRWKDIPRAQGGEHYQLAVPLWEWAPREPEEPGA